MPMPSRSRTLRTPFTDSEFRAPRCLLRTAVGSRNNGLRQQSTPCPQRRASRGRDHSTDSGDAVGETRRAHAGPATPPAPSPRATPGTEGDRRGAGWGSEGWRDRRRTHQRHSGSWSPPRPSPAKAKRGRTNDTARASERRPLGFPSRPSGSVGPHYPSCGSGGKARTPPPSSFSVCAPSLARPAPAPRRRTPGPSNPPPPLHAGPGRGRGDPRKGRGCRPRRAHALSHLTATCRAT